MAFLTYIRTQVLKWSGGMATDMAKTRSFTDVSKKPTKSTDQKTSATRPPSVPTKQAENSFPRLKRFDLS